MVSIRLRRDYAVRLEAAVRFRAPVFDTLSVALRAALSRSPKTVAKSKTKRRDRTAKLSTKIQAIDEIRAAAKIRSAHGGNTSCESGSGCGMAWRPVDLILFNGPELDHFFGVGKGRPAQTIRTCWILCAACHRSKTRGEPSASYWCHKFAEHCDRYGYTAEAALARKNGKWKAAKEAARLKSRRA